MITHTTTTIITSTIHTTITILTDNISRFYKYCNINQNKCILLNERSECLGD